MLGDLWALICVLASWMWNLCRGQSINLDLDLTERS